MLQKGRLYLALGTLALCVVVSGCAAGLGAHRREPAPAAGAAPPSVTSNVDEERGTVQPASAEVIASDEATQPSEPHTLEAAPLPKPPASGRVAEPEVVPLPPAATLRRPAAAAPPTTTPAATPEAGPPGITLHADDLDVRKALEILSRDAKVNILVSPKVSGKVTLDLQDKTPDEVLKAISRLCRLAIRQERDMVYVCTMEELRQSEEDEMPIRVYHINYVKSSDVEGMIKPLLSSKGKITKSPDADTGLKSDALSSSGGGSSSSSSAAANADVKAGGNSSAGGEMIVVQDYETVLKSVDRVVAEIDVQPVQVLIDAVILQVTLTKGMDLGVNYALLDGAASAAGVAGNGALINTAAGFTPSSVVTTAGQLSTGLAENVNGLKFGWTGGSVTGFIRAVENMAETKVLACPRILVLNRQRAEIHLGNQLGYQTTTVNQTSSTQNVQFLNVGTQLRVRPFASANGMIRMEVVPERSQGQLDSNGIPQTTTAYVTSNVMVPSGTTIVIGGLMDSEVDKTWEGIPFLSRIPLLGYLFRHTIDTTIKKELIVIITPYIWKPELSQTLNHLGPPNTLGLDRRVSQIPCEERRDGPSLYELLAPAKTCPEDRPPPGTLFPVWTGRAAPDSPKNPP